MKPGTKKSKKKGSKKTLKNSTTMIGQALVLVNEFLNRNLRFGDRGDKEAQLKFLNEYKEFERNMQKLVKPFEDSMQPQHVDVDPSFVQLEEADDSDEENEKIKQFKEMAHEKSKKQKCRLLSYVSGNSSTANDENGDSGKTSARTDYQLVILETEDSRKLTNGEASTSGEPSGNFFEDLQRCDPSVLRYDGNSNNKRKSTNDSSSPILNKRMKTCSQILKCEYDASTDIFTNITNVCESVNALTYRLHNYSFCNLGYVVCPYCENEENNNCIKTEEHTAPHTCEQVTHHSTLDSRGGGCSLNDDLGKIDDRMNELLGTMRKRASFKIR